MDLYILRHGEAHPIAASDQQRELTEQGRLQTKKLAQVVDTLGIKVNAVFASPYIRAQQTAELVSATFGVNQIHNCDLITPDGDPQSVINWLARQYEVNSKQYEVNSKQQSILLVTHQPFAGSLIATFVNGSGRYDSSIPPMMTSSLAHLTMDLCAAGCADLQWIKSAPHFN